jgi:hypothetical protein
MTLSIPPVTDLDDLEMDLEFKEMPKGADVWEVSGSPFSQCAIGILQRRSEAIYIFSHHSTAPGED